MIRSLFRSEFVRPAAPPLPSPTATPPTSPAARNDLLSRRSGRGEEDSFESAPSSDSSMPDISGGQDAPAEASAPESAPSESQESAPSDSGSSQEAAPAESAPAESGESQEAAPSESAQLPDAGDPQVAVESEDAAPSESGSSPDEGEWAAAEVPEATDEVAPEDAEQVAAIEGTPAGITPDVDPSEELADDVATAGGVSPTVGMGETSSPIDPGKVGVVLNDNIERIPTVNELNELGVKGVRITLSSENYTNATEDVRGQWAQRLADYQRNGIDVVLNVGGEIAPGRPMVQKDYQDGGPLPEGFDKNFEAWKQSAYLPALQQVLNELGPSTKGFEIWNEPDEPKNRVWTENGKELSYLPGLPSATYGELLRDAYNKIQEYNDAHYAENPGDRRQVITAGMDSGQPSYLEKAAHQTGDALYADAIGLHPYGKEPSTPAGEANSLQDIVANYSSFQGPNGNTLPIHITEAAKSDDPSHDYIPSMVKAANDMEEVVRSYFFWQKPFDNYPGLVSVEREPGTTRSGNASEDYKRLQALLKP